MPMASVVQRLGDHTVRVWRASVARDSYGAETKTYAPVIESARCIVNRPTAPEGTVASGLANTGSRRMYVDVANVIESRDIIELVTGPDTQGHRLWEVDGPPTRPRDNHLQLDCIAWHGELPEVS